LQSLGLVHLQAAVFLPPAVKRLDGDRGFFAGLWGGFSVRDADFNLPQHRHDLLWFVPLHGHDPLFLQVDSLSFHLVQTWPVRSGSACGSISSDGLYTAPDKVPNPAAITVIATSTVTP